MVVCCISLPKVTGSSGAGAGILSIIPFDQLILFNDIAGGVVQGKIRQKQFLLADKIVDQTELVEEQFQGHGGNAGQQILVGEEIISLDPQLKHEFPNFFPGGGHMKSRPEDNAYGAIAENAVKLIIGRNKVAGLLVDHKQLPQVGRGRIFGKLYGVFDGDRLHIPVDTDIHTGEVGDGLCNIGVIHIAAGVRGRGFRFGRICGLFCVHCCCLFFHHVCNSNSILLFSFESIIRQYVREVNEVPLKKYSNITKKRTKLQNKQKNNIYNTSVVKL